MEWPPADNAASETFLSEPLLPEIEGFDDDLRDLGAPDPSPTDAFCEPAAARIRTRRASI